MKCVYSAALFVLAASSLVAAQHCGSFRDSRERSSIDFAPLDGYTDVCSRDFQLCVMLTQAIHRVSKQSRISFQTQNGKNIRRASTKDSAAI